MATIEMTPQATFACDLSVGWLWTHGWVDKRKFKGKCLSEVEHLEGFDEEPDESRRVIAAGTVVHGWVITVEGDMSGCGWDSTLYFEEAEPQVYEDLRLKDPNDPEDRPIKVRVWAGAVEYVELHVEDTKVLFEEERAAEVIDGPHKATWLKPKGGR